MIEGSIYSANIEVQRRTFWETKNTQVRTKSSGAWSGWINYVTDVNINDNISQRMATGSVIVGPNFHQIRLQVDNLSILSIYDNDTEAVIGYVNLLK